MPVNRKVPLEIIQFENLLNKPNSDPTGLAGFFTSGEIYVTRVPARSRFLLCEAALRCASCSVRCGGLRRGAARAGF